MTRLVLALARAELRATPERATMIAVLLASAAVLPSLLRLRPLVGVILAVGVAGAAAAGVTAQNGRRHDVLTLNGADPGVEMRLATAAVAVPGSVAAVIAGLVGVLRDGSPHPLAAVAVALVVLWSSPRS